MKNPDVNINRVEIKSKLNKYSDVLNKLGQLVVEINEAVKIGDKSKAQTCAKEVLSFSINKQWNRVQDWKRYANTVNINLKSSAIAGGLDFIDAMVISQRFIKEIEDATNVDDIKSKIHIIVGEYAQAVFDSEHKNCSKTIKQVCQYIKQNYDQNVSTKILADHFHINASHLSRQFKKEMNVTITNYIQQKRIQEAKGLLITKKYTITEVANMVGFNDVQYFTNTFKKIEQITPSEYILKSKNFIN